MKSLLKYVLILIIPYLSFAQNTKDVGFLKDMKYLELATRINCDSTTGTTIEARICLNIELRKVDSIMLSDFNQFLKKIDNDSLKNVFKDYQANWESERKSISLLKCEGLDGGAEANTYMYSMIEHTKLRIKAIRKILEELY